MEWPTNDDDFMDGVLDEVEESDDGYTFSFDCMGLFVNKPTPIEPKVGMKIRVYGQLGRPIRGVFIEEHQVFYRTVQQEKECHTKWVEEMDKKDRENFEEHRENHDQRIAALPKVFQDRIKRFQEGNPNFRHKHEGYELFCCEQAVVIANAFRTVEEIDGWVQSSFVNQMSLPGISDGHSGNTLGCAAMLAKLMITKPDLVTKAHGAMTPMVGCVEYGCSH